MSLAAETLAAARVRGWRIATAESCTGGMVSAALTDVAGSSDVFERGFVTYTNTAKTEMLGVREATLAAHGAVSEEVAREMALGALVNSDADLAVSITGIAGPGGGTDEKPCGLVYISTDGPDGTRTSRHVFFRDRPRVRLRAAQVALNTLRCILDG